MDCYFRNMVLIDGYAGVYSPVCGKLMKVDVQGNIVGWIYPASEGTWDMSWDGQYLWATQRTNENWPDDKLFALKILEIKPPQP